jgi:ferrous iron transport protein B
MIGKRAAAVGFLSSNEEVAGRVRSAVGEATWPELVATREQLQARFHMPLGYVMAQERQCYVQDIVARVTTQGTPVKTPWVDRFERWTIHPFWGVPIVLAVLYLVYVLVGQFGAGTLVDLLEEKLFGQWLNPLAKSLASKYLPLPLARDFLVGEYGVITMALTYGLAIILPIVTTFFLVFSFLEDTGYLPRLSIMLDRGFRVLGLNGKAVLPMVLGLGCDTMATMTARILATRKERILVTLLLALGVPCSAQLGVILAMMAHLTVWGLIVWSGSVALVMIAVGAIAARILPGQRSDFTIELPPIRLPLMGNITLKTLARVKWYLKEVLPLFVLGTALLFVMDRTHLLFWVERMAEPVVSRFMGLPPQTAESFLIGFLRRDYGAAGLFRLATQGVLDHVQILVSMVTITLFIPCIANFFMIMKEQGWKTALAITAFIFPFAFGVGGVLNQILRALRLPV